jgi:hypothetical protein
MFLSEGFKDILAFPSLRAKRGNLFYLLCHSRVGGNPSFIIYEIRETLSILYISSFTYKYLIKFEFFFLLDSRLRGNDGVEDMRLLRKLVVRE